MPEMTEVDKPAVAEAKPEQSSSSTESDTDDEIPELEDAGAGAAGTATFPGAAAAGLPIDMVSKAKQSRGEKKARKIMSKLGLKPVSIEISFLVLLQGRWLMNVEVNFKIVFIISILTLHYFIVSQRFFKSTILANYSLLIIPQVALKLGLVP